MTTGSFVGAGDGVVPLRVVAVPFLFLLFLLFLAGPDLPVPARPVPVGRRRPLPADPVDVPRPPAEPLPPRPAFPLPVLRPPVEPAPDRLPDVRAPEPA